jgi:1-acylglycerone phosphate reductase
MIVGNYQGIYNASKAADNVFSETLRLELSPLGIKVVTVITGGVASNIMTNGPKTQLPSSSKYASMEKQLMEMGEGNDGISRMSSQDYAERVVSDVLKGATGLIWRGNNASMTRYAAAFMPRFLSVSTRLGSRNHQAWEVRLLI